VLYIEDNVPNVSLMAQILRHRPMIELMHAGSGEAGIVIAREQHVDLILLDLHLPDCPGEEVLRRLWEDPKSRAIPVVVVTADAAPGLLRRLGSSAVRACLTKPLDIREVRKVIDGILADHPPAGT
jgi:CheY-like chemotaxis protein